MKLGYRALRGLVVAIHVAGMIAIGAPTIGLILGFWRIERPLPSGQFGFVILVVTTAASHLLFGRCYMTLLENWIVSRGGLGPRYEASFLVHYVPFLSERLVSRLVLLVRSGAVGLVSYLLFQTRCSLMGSRSSWLSRARSVDRVDERMNVV